MIDFREALIVNGIRFSLVRWITMSDRLDLMDRFLDPYRMITSACAVHARMRARCWRMRSVARDIGPELWPLLKGRFQKFVESKILAGLLSNFTHIFTDFWTTYTNFFRDFWKFEIDSFSTWRDTTSCTHVKCSFEVNSFKIFAMILVYWQNWCVLRKSQWKFM